MNSDIVFRVDSSEKIGYGHVMRCLTLGNTLRNIGYNVAFICRDDPGNINAKILQQNFQVHLLSRIVNQSSASYTEIERPTPLMHSDFLSVPQFNDAQSTLEIMKAKFPFCRTLIVDHYGLDIEWDRCFYENYFIIKIDDLADRKHLCHLIIDQGFYLDIDSRYRPFVPNTCKMALGPQYAILRPQFARPQLPIVKNVGKLSQVLICFGGRDRSGYSIKIASYVLQNTHFDVVCMGVVEDLAGINQLQCRYPERLNVTGFIENTYELFSKADLYIGAGGVITWERFSCGLPGIVFSIAENQVVFSKVLSDKGLQIYLGDVNALDFKRLSDAIQIMQDRDYRSSMIKGMMSIVDGHGTQRIANLISNEIATSLSHP